MPAKTIHLDHGARFVREARGGSLVVAASADGRVSICDPTPGPSTGVQHTWAFAGVRGPDLETIYRVQALFASALPGATADAMAACLRHQASDGVRAVSAHPSADLVALIGGADGGLAAVDFDGHLVAGVGPQPLRPGSETPRPRGFWGCQFDAGGDLLWSVAPVSDREFEVQLRSARDWSIIAAAVAPKHAGQCDCTFEGAGPAGAAALTLAFGQEGSDLYWLRRAGTRIEVAQESRLTDPGPVEFSPDGDDCLVHAVNGCELHRFEYPSLRPAGQCDDLIDGVSMGSQACYLSRDHALIVGYPWRVVLFDVRGMRARKEVEVEGHDPRPLREWNPALRGSKKELWTDIRSVARVGSMAVLVFDRDYGAGRGGGRDSLLCILIKDLVR